MPWEKLVTPQLQGRASEIFSSLPKNFFWLLLSLHIMPEIVADCFLSTWKWWQHWGEQQEETKRTWCLDCIIELLNQLPSKLKSFFSHYERNDTSLYSHPSVFSVVAYGLCKRWSIEMQKENNTIPINAYVLLKVVMY